MVHGYHKYQYIYIYNPLADGDLPCEQETGLKFTRSTGRRVPIKKVINDMVGTLHASCWAHAGMYQGKYLQFVQYFSVCYSLIAFVGTDLLQEPFGSGSCSSVADSDFTGTHLKHCKIDIATLS